LGKLDRKFREKRRLAKDYSRMGETTVQPLKGLPTGDFGQFL